MTRTLGRTHAALLALALAPPVALPAFAQTAPYPSRPVTVVVPFPPGGGTDIAARLAALKLQQKWGQPVVVENRAGAAGQIGADAVAKAKPDGYTLLVGNVGTQSINPVLYKKLPYDPDHAFAAIALITDLPFAMLVTPSLPAKTVKELIADAKAAPDKYTFASSGSGGSPHLTGELFQKEAGIKMLHVPYKGGGPAMSDLMAGHVNILFASALESTGYVKSGKLRALAVTSLERSAALSDVPTLSESGLTNFESGSWVAMLAPAGTPPAIVNKIAADIKEVMATPDTRQSLAAQGALPRTSSPAELQTLIDNDRRRYGRLIDERGIRAA